MNQQAQRQISQETGSVGLRAALNILGKWGCTADQECSILGMKRSSYYKHRENPAASARLSNDQLERISYILNMHAALRVTFDNPENLYGFVSMNNNNPFFNGATPLDIMASGRFSALYETFKRVDALRGAGL